MTGASGQAPPPSLTAGRLFVFLASLTIVLVTWCLSFSMSVFTAGEVMYAAISAGLHFLFIITLSLIVIRSFATGLGYRWSMALLALSLCMPAFVLLLYSMLIAMNVG